MNVESILALINTATQLVKGIGSLVNDATEVLSGTDADKVSTAAAALRAENNRLEQVVSNKLG
jgi:ribosomal protein L6P/L9E